MSLDKAIKSGREKRKPYYSKPERLDRSCRHGSCPSCEANRTHNSNRRIFNAKEEVEETLGY